MKLSDLYTVPEDSPALELTALMLNINAGHNEKLLTSCKTLGDYATYVARVRHYAQNMPIEDAVERAITECIAEGILADFLSKHRAEAKKVSIYEFDEEKYRRLEREDNLAEGFQQGEEAGMQAGMKLAECLVKAGRTDDFLKAVSDSAYRKKLYQEFKIGEDSN